MSGETVQPGTALEPGEQARVDVYRLLGALLARPPDAALLELLRGITPEATGDTTAMTAAWQALQTAAQQATPAAVEEEYFSLFIGLGRGEVVPYASFYIHGLIMEKVLAALRKELAALGIARRADVAEPEDHAAALCEVMGMLISAHGLHLQQSVFFERYLGSWLDRFFEDLGRAGEADFYRAVALAGEQFLTLEKQYFALPT